MIIIKSCNINNNNNININVIKSNKLKIIELFLTTMFFLDSIYIRSADVMMMDG